MSFNKADIQYNSAYRLERNKLYVIRTLIEDHKAVVVQPNEQTSMKDFIPFLQKDLRSQVFYE